MLCGQPVFCYRLGFIGLVQPLQLLVPISPLSHLKSGGLLDKDKGRVAAPNRMNFWKEFMLHILGTLYRAFLA